MEMKYRRDLLTKNVCSAEDLEELKDLKDFQGLTLKISGLFCTYNLFAAAKGKFEVTDELLVVL